MAFARATPSQRAAAVPDLLRGAGARPPQQRDMLLRLGAAGLEGYVFRQAGADGAAELAWGPFLAANADRRAFLDFAVELMLYAPPPARRAGPVGGLFDPGRFRGI